ncbi:hypothetical protein R6Q59_021322 [Mikania micrantha]
MSFRTGHAFKSSSSYSPLQFTFSEIKLATKNFDESLVIGRGGFGKVYRGTVTCSDGNILMDVAIKRLDSDSSQGAGEFWAEVEMLSKLRHCHLVSLVGYCSDRQEMILVYEYMPNGTLADRIHKSRAPLLTWVRRLKICIGAARGLDYLHTGTGIKHGVIHRDVKSSNILLDGNWAAKISDFGLSKIGPINQPSTYVNTLVRGTFGYLDPEYFQTGRLTRKSDVYAFGVVLFEVLCGKQAVDRSVDEEHWGLATWAQDSIKEGRLKQIVDPDLREIISPKCLKEFALLASRCLHSRPRQRPTMAEVVMGLESILALQEKPDSTLLMKIFRTKVPTSMSPPNPENSVGGTSLESLDIYLYTVGGEHRIVRRFDFNTILDATQNFSNAYKNMSGDMPMYKGRLQNGQDITIVEYYNARAHKQCMNEASFLVRLEHENVIPLLGYCIERTKVYLLYDFALNATLAGLIYDLDWNKRYKIILGVARVLVYLHNHAPIRIIHREVKPHNILLDESFNPKLSGFRIAITINETDCIYVDDVAGTLFGMLVLETATGQSIIDLWVKGIHVIDYFTRNWLEETLSRIIDARIDVDANLMTKTVEIGLLCVQTDPVHRPTMKEVFAMLSGTLSPTISVSEMRARMTNVAVSYPDWFVDPETDYDTSAVDAFVSELCPR